VLEEKLVLVESRVPGSLTRKGREACPFSPGLGRDVSV
jgi:hypothetical protein